MQPDSRRCEAILELQGGVCALCGEKPEREGASSSCWHIDHDHRCRAPSDFARSICGGCVRGLLHSGCNARGVAWHEALSLIVGTGAAWTTT
ncbi:endonuclease domain-containing protein [Streptomyces sp. NPDC101227]|uniref:endonuclease domain-containing protein n=1 Tax=Streptomyces sp. NPDC101227 TaxID=3366136 RepID=UPI003803C1DA